jgi:hypothetical protein
LDKPTSCVVVIVQEIVDLSTRDVSAIPQQRVRVRVAFRVPMYVCLHREIEVAPP